MARWRSRQLQRAGEVAACVGGVVVGGGGVAGSSRQGHGVLVVWQKVKGQRPGRQSSARDWMCARTAVTKVAAVSGKGCGLVMGAGYGLWVLGSVANCRECVRWQRALPSDATLRLFPGAHLSAHIPALAFRCSAIL